MIQNLRLFIVLVTTCIYPTIIPCAECVAEVDVTNTEIWGPAFNNEANVPVRYFYLQPRDQLNELISTDLGDKAFQLSVRTPEGARIRSYNQFVNLHNGSYIGRFRMYSYAGPAVAAITYNGKHVAKSPYYLTYVHSDDCYCPSPLDTWMDAAQCPASYQQITEDLKPHPSIPLDGLRDKMLSRFPRGHYCHYAIKDNKIYRECIGTITDFKMFTDQILLSLTKKMILPDIEIYWNLGDWPLERSTESPLPMISWCGSDDTMDIVLPTYDIVESVLSMQGRVSLDPLSIQGHGASGWDSKIEKGFFRGRDSRQERLDLAEMSLKHPDYINASITNYFFFKPEPEKHGPKASFVSFLKFFEYKYQLNIDGTVAAYRFPYLLLGDSLVMKQDSKYYEHFYKELKAWEHYVPLKRDLTDTVEKIKWAKENDDEARRIANSGRSKAQELLTPINVLCYHAAFFQEYASRQVGKVEVLSSMEEVKHEKNACQCTPHSHRTKDEL